MQAKKPLHPFLRGFLIAVGSFSLVVGIIGIFLPLVPTTPLLLLAGACYVRSSEKLYQWLITHRHLGPYITNWKSGKGIPYRVKVLSIVFVWLSMTFSAFFVPFLLLKGMFLFGCIFFTWFILRQKTLEERG